MTLKSRLIIPVDRRVGVHRRVSLKKKGRCKQRTSRELEQALSEVLSSKWMWGKEFLQKKITRANKEEKKKNTRRKGLSKREKLIWQRTYENI